MEIRHLQAGTAVCDLGLAVNDRVKRNEQWVDEVTYVDVTLWGRTAEVAGEYLTKGSSVLIDGRLRLEEWTDKQTNQKRSKLKVVGERLQMLGGKKGGGEERQSQGRSKQTESEYGSSDDDVPF